MRDGSGPDDAGFLARVLRMRSADADPYGPYRSCLDPDPHVYLRLLMPADDDKELVDLIAALVLSGAGRRFVMRFLEQADWRRHVFAALAAPLARRPSRFAGALWRAFDQGSWVSPQLAGSLYHVDSGFVDQAWWRVRARCPVLPHPELASLEELARGAAHGPESEKNLAALLGLLECEGGWGERVRREREAPDVRAMLEAERSSADERAVRYAVQLGAVLERHGLRPVPVRPAARFRRGRDPALTLFRELTGQGLQTLRPGIHETEFAVAAVSLRDGLIELMAQPRESPEDDLRRYRARWTGPRADRPPAWPEDVPFLPGIEGRLDDPSGPHMLEAVWQAPVEGRAELRSRLMDIGRFDGPRDFLETVDGLLVAIAPSIADVEAAVVVQTLAEDLAARAAAGAMVDDDPAWTGLWEAFHGAPLERAVKRSLWDEVRRILARRESDGWSILEQRQDAGPENYLLKIVLGRGDERDGFMVTLSCGRASFARFTVGWTPRPAIS